MIHVPVYCTATPHGNRCLSQALDHVHGPLPCANGQDAAHHAFLPPKSIALEVGGQRRYLRLRATE